MEQSQSKSNQIDKKAPDFILPTVTGNLFRLSELVGSKVVIFTWASWWGCRNQLPVWQQFYETNKSLGLEVLAIAMDGQGSARANPYLEKAGATYTSVIDTEGITSQLYGFKTVANGFLVDESGILKFIKISIVI